MKVGTDGVLLGAWCRLRPHTDKAILDIGTGTGVIALQLAQRTESWNATIEAVEIDPEASETARRNFAASPWSTRIELHAMPVQQFTARFDHIVSNPPYFTDSLTSPDPSKTLARHTSSLSYDELIAVCNSLLLPNGRISLILPTGAQAERMIAAALEHGFAPSRLTEVHSTPLSGPKRLLIEFSRRPQHPLQAPHATPPETALSLKTGKAPTTPPEPPIPSPETSSLVIEGAAPGTFSAGYRALTRDFYLYF